MIVETLRQEEERFRRTLGRGMSLLEEATSGLGTGGVLAGETAFKLYDTYGFPLDLTQDAVRAKGLTVDTAGFDTAMERQRQMARDNWSGSGQQAQGAEWLALRERLGPTDFTGYDAIEAAGETLALIKDAVLVQSAGAGDTVEVLFDRTPFYGEGGGQAGDRGELDWTGGKGLVVDTQKHARRPARPHRQDHRGRAGRGHARASAGGRRAPPAHPRQPLRRPPGAQGAQQCARPPRLAEGPAGRRRAHALRLQPRRPPDPPTSSTASRPRSTP